MHQDWAKTGNMLIDRRIFVVDAQMGSMAVRPGGHSVTGKQEKNLIQAVIFAPTYLMHLSIMNLFKV